MPIVISRQKLYSLVWSEPRTKLAKKLGVSDVAIGKQCKKYGIPTPPSGYWARKASGKPVTRPQLLPRFPGNSEFVEFENNWYQSTRWPRKSPNLLEQPIPDPPVFEEDLSSVRDREVKGLGKVGYPQLSNRTHPLILKLLELD